MQLSDFDYELPPELVAQEPARERDGARLLVHDEARDLTEHSAVRELPCWLRPGDLLVINDTRVLPARLFGRRDSGGRVELLLVEPEGRAGSSWQALVNPARKLRPGEVVRLDGGGAVRMIARPAGGNERPRATWSVELLDEEEEPVDVPAFLEEHGHVPLPPYIRRGDDLDEARDRERYQTVYATHPGAVAAPTAGLHFTPELMERVLERDVEIARVTLHVGHGTFRPIDTESLADHRMHAERFELGAATAEAVRATRARGGRVVAVGTTSVRVLESCTDPEGNVRSGVGETDLFLFPGRPVRVVDALLTNFHLPRSSLLLLVAAFVGRDRILRLYREAIAERYRFYSYGDAMLLLRAGLRRRAV